VSVLAPTPPIGCAEAVLTMPAPPRSTVFELSWYANPTRGPIA
jgi:hypothetical protein